MRAGLVDIAHGISHTEARTGRGAQAATWLRWPIGLFLLVHGVVHLMGAVLLLELGEPGELTYAVARPEAGSVLAVLFAGLWSVAMALFIVAGLQVLRGRGWSAWLIAASACSIVAIAPMMSAAPVGMIVSLVALLTGVWAAWRTRVTPMANQRPAYLPQQARDAWEQLADPSGVTPATAATAALPEVIARWLDRVCTPMSDAHGVRLRMHGEIRLGQWRPFVAEQVLSPSGFVWAAEAGRAPMQIKGCDLYVDGAGRMDWRLFGLIPVMRQSGADITRSAAARLAGELLVLSPFHARSPLVAWAEASTDTAVAVVTAGGVKHRVSLRFDDDGRLRELSLPRWGDPDGTGFREETFGVVFDGEQRFGDIVLPASFTAGWWPGTARWQEGMFFRCTIDAAECF